MFARDKSERLSWKNAEANTIESSEERQWPRVWSRQNLLCLVVPSSTTSKPAASWRNKKFSSCQARLPNLAIDINFSIDGHKLPDAPATCRSRRMKFFPLSTFFFFDQKRRKSISLSGTEFSADKCFDSGERGEVEKAFLRCRSLASLPTPL